MIGMIGAVLGWLIGFGLTSLLASIRFDVGGMVRNDHFPGVVGNALLDRADLLPGPRRGWPPGYRRGAAAAKPVDIIRGAA